MERLSEILGLIKVGWAVLIIPFGFVWWSFKSHSSLDKRVAVVESELEDVATKEDVAVINANINHLRESLDKNK